MNADFVPGVGQNSAKIPNGSELLRLGVVSRVRRFNANLKVTRPSQLCGKGETRLNGRGKDGGASLAKRGRIEKEERKNERRTRSGIEEGEEWMEGRKGR